MDLKFAWELTVNDLGATFRLLLDYVYQQSNCSVNIVLAGSWSILRFMTILIQGGNAGILQIKVLALFPSRNALLSGFYSPPTSRFTLSFPHIWSFACFATSSHDSSIVTNLFLST
ncbi:hypothetical protein FRC12_021414 [Ceratobasidium sp. 428]|nr:hypothetical protein FRC12_021414 [Ceratobasidium sp. 428]